MKVENETLSTVHSQLSIEENVPKLRFGEFEAEWTSNFLPKIAKIERGKFTPRPRNNPIYYNGNIPFVQTSDVANSNGYIRNFTQTLNEKGLGVSKLFAENTVLITIAANIGYTGVLQIPMACPDSLINLEPVNTDPYFLHFLLSTHQRKMDNIADPGAQKNVNKAFLNKYKVTYCLLPEQQKIASFLSKVDEKIGLLSDKKDKLTEYKRGVMQQLFNGKWHEQDGQLNFVPPTLRFKADDGSEFPAWEEREFDDIFNFSTGKNIKQNEASPEFDTPCVRYGELYHMYGEVITTVVNGTNLEHSELTFSNGNEILLPSAGEDPLDIGSASALTLSDVAIGRTINVLRPKGNIDYCPVYVSFYINEKLRKKISTLARGASISNVYNSDLRGLSLPLPSIEEQYVIKSFLLKIEEKLKLTNSELEKAKEWKKGLLQQMFV